MNVGLAFLHIVVGVLFVGHGTQKLFGVFGGHGLEGTAGFFESVGLRPGRLHAAAAGLAETGGGALLALGLLTPLGAALVIAVMTAAVTTVHARNGIWVTDNGFEYNLVLVAAAVALAGVGAGTVSLDFALGIDVAGTGWALAALGAGLLGGLGAVLSRRLAGSRSAGDAQRASTA
jgi:putative oxidoreductase